jgi:O-antigen/teichoic acid export membrane protein
LLLSTGRVVFKFVVDVISFLLGAFLALLLIPQYGAVGAAITMLAMVLMNHSIFLYVTTKQAWDKA